MSEISDFLERYDQLVVGTVRASYYQLIQEGNERVHGTFPVPALPDAQAIEQTAAALPDTLPTGQHRLNITAFGTNGNVLGSVGWVTAGRSQSARQAINDAQSLAKAMQMHVDTAQSQMQQSDAARQAAEERAIKAEGKIAEMMGEQIKMVDMVHTMMLSAERAALDKGEHEMRMKVLQMVGEGLLPLVNKFAEVGAEGFDHKVNMWRHEWRQKEAEAREKSNGQASTSNGQN